MGKTKLGFVLLVDFTLGFGLTFLRLLFFCLLIDIPLSLAHGNANAC